MTTTSPTETVPGPEPAASAALLEAEDVTVRFGGVVALDSVRIRVPQGGAVGLVGPNGAGKTTLFGVLSGLIRPRSGRVRLNGVDVTSKSPQARAKLGLSRTFQRMELFTELTVREHLIVARRVREGRQSLLGFFRDLSGFGERLSPDEAAAVDDILDLVGLGPVADRPAESVPLGTGRLVEVAPRAGVGAERDAARRAVVGARRRTRPISSARRCTECTRSAAPPSCSWSTTSSS